MQAARGTAIAESGDSKRVVRVIMIVVALTVYVADQATKQLALTYLTPGQPVPVIGDLLRLLLVFNPGAAFSLGEGFTVGLSVFAILALSGVVFVIAPRVANRPWAFAIGLIACGVGGNLTDRLLRPPGPLQGYVVDFLQLPYWPIFNVADMCLVFGAGTVVWLTVVRPLPMTSSGPVAEMVADQGDEA